ncbi:MAG: GH25 family lysozyme [Longibaculum sp.]
MNQKRKLLIISMIGIVAIAIMIFFIFQSFQPKKTNHEEETNNIITNQVGDASVDPENMDEKEEGKKIVSTELNIEQGKSNGIDVSKWQGKIDWNKVKKSHVDFAFIRIGYRGENGVIYKDDNADYNIQQAQKAGVLVGVYFYSTATSQKEAIEEANWTLKCIESYSISYPVVYDCEGYKHTSSRTYHLDVQQRTENAAAFLDTISKAGYETMFYTSLSDLDSHWNISNINKKHKIWIAQYSSQIYPQKQKPDYHGKCHAWQYTNKGQVNGIEGNVDMVVCYFENKKAQPKKANASLPMASVPLTDQDKIYSSVNEKVTAKSETNLRSLATTKSDIVTTLKNGETVTRIGVGSNGWSKLRYKNKTVYAITSYLTTDLKAKEPEEDIVLNQKFESQKDKVTAKDQVNLRSLPSTDSEVVGTLNSGDFLERSAISQSGWSRLSYKGKTVYAISSYLSHEVVEKPKPQEEPKPEQTDGFTAVDEQVTAKSETNLRDKPSMEGTQVVHTLKNGEYVKRIGIHSNGWSKLEYNGQVVYAISSYLTN